MALKPDRVIMAGDTDISFFCNQTNEKGSVMVLSAGGSGASMDDSAALVIRPSTVYASGQTPLGILLCDVVSGDLTKTHLNQHKDEVQVGSKVTLAKRGVLVTNVISGTVTAGQGAYASATASGALCSLADNNALLTATPGTIKKVGTWLSGKDADGFAKVAINLV